MSNPLFTWQTEAWQLIQGMRARLPHAILLFGAEGIGKTIFAEHLAQSLLCETPDGTGHACGHCLSCGWFAQYSHPDYRRVRPELLDQEDALSDDAEADAADKTGEKSSEKSAAKASKTPSKEIVINQVRALADFMNISTHRQGRRVVLLYPAEAVNSFAANALLKSLEEPNPNTVFVLVSHSIDQLLPTILSRCHKIPLPMPKKADALAWLKENKVRDAETWLALKGGAPLAAMAMAESESRAELEVFLKEVSEPSLEASLRLAEKIHKLDMSTTVTWLQSWLYDIVSVKQSGIIRYYPSYARELKLLADRVDTHALHAFVKTANEKQAVAKHPLSPKLFLEDLLLNYATLFS